MLRHSLPRIVALAMLCLSTSMCYPQQIKDQLAMPAAVQKGTPAPHNFHRHYLARSKQFPAPAPRTPVQQEVFVPFFLSGHGFTPTLWIENIRIDTPITVRPALILRHHTEVLLPEITIAANDTVQIDINAEFARLHDSGEIDSVGAVNLRYDFPSNGAIAAFIRNSDPSDGLFVNSHSRNTGQFRSTGLDAILWTPHEDGEGLISIVNTSSEVRKVTTRFISNSTDRLITQTSIGPKGLSVIRLDNFLQDAHKSGAGIRITSDGKPGDIIAEGVILNKKSRYAKRIPFSDMALHFHDHTLRSDFLYLGKQPASYGFPDIAFNSVAVIRNTGDSPVRVTPVVGSENSLSSQAITLPDILIEGSRTALLDFNAAQQAGLIPAEFHSGSLELHYDGGDNSVIADLFTHDEKGGYETGPSLIQLPGNGNSSLWKIDGKFQTSMAIRNVASIGDTVKLTFYRGDGKSYTKLIDVPGGQVVRVNVRDLQADPPDKNGNIFQGSSGIVSAHGKFGSKSRLLVDRLIYSPDQSDYVGYPASPCYDTLDAFIDFSELDNSSNDSFSSTYNEFFSDGSQAQAVVPPDAISNPLATANGATVNFNTSSLPAGDIQTVEFDYFEEETSGCETFLVEFSLFFEFELATTKSKVTSHSIFNGVDVRCELTAWCTPETSPPACNPSFVDQFPILVGMIADCAPFYRTSWLAERSVGDSLWNCFPLLPGENATRDFDASLGACTK